MGKLLRALVGVVGALWLGIAGAGAMWWWDRRPAGVPAYHLILWTWTAPDSLAAKLAKSRADLQTCHTNVASLESAVDAQNAAVGALAADGQRRADAAKQAAQAAIPARRAAQAKAAAIMAAPETGGACAAAEALIRETIR